MALERGDPCRHKSMLPMQLCGVQNLRPNKAGATFLFLDMFGICEIQSWWSHLLSPATANDDPTESDGDDDSVLRGSPAHQANHLSTTHLLPFHQKFCCAPHLL